jgi:hypothetical protein
VLPGLDIASDQPSEPTRGVTFDGCSFFVNKAIPLALVFLKGGPKAVGKGRRI